MDNVLVSVPLANHLPERTITCASFAPPKRLNFMKHVSKYLGHPEGPQINYNKRFQGVEDGALNVNILFIGSLLIGLPINRDPINLATY